MRAPYEEKQWASALKQLEDKSDPEDSGCVTWRGRVANNGTPAIFTTAWHSPTKSYRRRTFVVPRLTWKLKHGASPSRDLKNQCGNRLCVNADHWRLAPGGASSRARKEARKQIDPWVPTAPLVDFVRAMGGLEVMCAVRGLDADGMSHLYDRMTRLGAYVRTRLSVVDQICCEELGMHPAEIYGEIYWDLEAA